MIILKTHYILTAPLWLPPECLLSPDLPMTKEADIYSAGIIIQEIMTRSGPFQTECAQMDMDGKELFQD